MKLTQAQKVEKELRADIRDLKQALQYQNETIRILAERLPVKSLTVPWVKGKKR